LCQAGWGRLQRQNKLYRKAKNEPGYRFYQLYDKVYREDTLQHAYALAKANDGAPGVDGESFEDIERRGKEEWWNGLRKELHDQTYRSQPLRRKTIDKPGGGQRALGIPTVSANCTGRANRIWDGLRSAIRSSRFAAGASRY